MRIFHASLSLSVLRKYFEVFKNPLHVLVSLAVNKSERRGFLITFRHMVGGLFGDSGAWSVAKGNSTLTMEKVISHLREWGQYYDLYFNFDTDFSDQGFDSNIANQVKMEQEGLKPVPVIHNFFDGEIDCYVQSGKYDWLALGSSQSSKFMNIKYAIDRIKWGNPNIKIHWFGGSKFYWLCRLPIASCDTTSWAATGEYGYIMFWNPRNPKFNKSERIYVSGRIRKFKKNEYHFETFPWKNELEAYLLNTFGLTYADLSGYDSAVNMQLVNTRFFVEQERRINEERIRRGIPLE